MKKDATKSYMRNRIKLLENRVTKLKSEARANKLLSSIDGIELKELRKTIESLSVRLANSNMPENTFTHIELLSYMQHIIEQCATKEIHSSFKKADDIFNELMQVAWNKANTKGMLY
jgi:hypothetical protein